MPTDERTRSNWWRSLTLWLDSGMRVDEPAPARIPDRVDWLRCLPFLAMHAACLSVIWVGVSWVAFGVAAGLYVLRMFAITGFYHRYFSHRTFRTSRVFQFLMALLGATAGQRGPLWWAGHHRHHHNHSDTEQDFHSPLRHGFLYSHLGWFMTPSGFATPVRYVRDWMKYPELRFLDRFDWLMPIVLAVSMFMLGAILERFAPSLGTDGWQMLLWGFLISTITLYHATYTINSVAHQYGSQRYDTGDDSRNNFWLALLTLGEGWHNNHHHYPAAARQGFFWWEIDVTYYGLVGLSWLGLIRDLRPVSARALHDRRLDRPRVAQTPSSAE